MADEYEINVGGMTPENYDPERDPSGAIGQELADLMIKRKRTNILDRMTNRESGLSNEQLERGFRGFQPVN